MISPKNKLRMCFLFMVLVAVIIGGIYYYNVGMNVEEWGQGTLVMIKPWISRSLMRA